MNMLIPTFTKKFISVLFVPISLQMYSIVPFTKSYESRSFIFTQFRRENVLKQGHAEKKMFSNAISRSIKVNWVF